jgi:hypothetical protein
MRIASILSAASLTAMLVGVEAGHAVEVVGHFPTAATATLTSSDTTVTANELASFLGAPDDVYTGIGRQWVTYDLGAFRIIDGVGNDFNVYEHDGGAAANGVVEFNSVDILVSADNINFFNVEASFGPAIDLIGDNTHGIANFRRSYDVGAAVTALAASQFRYLRIAGTGSGLIDGFNGFDLDAVGLVNFIDTTPPVVPPVDTIPEPASWAMLIAGFGLVGAAQRRRRFQTTVAAM